MIEITCPNCNFSRGVPESTIPQGAKTVKCPRCKTSFELPVTEEEKKPEAVEEAESVELVEGVEEVETVEVAEAVPVDEPDEEIQDEAVENIQNIEADEENDAPYEPLTGKTEEAPEESGYFTGLYRTFTAVLFSPAEFFSVIKKTQGIGEAFTFGILTGTVGAIFQLFWQFKTNPEYLNMLMKLVEDPPDANQLFFTSMILAPVSVIVTMFIMTIFLHLFLTLLGGTGRGIEWTFKVVAYSFAPAVFRILPVIGDPAAFIWGMIIIVAGLRVVHGTTNSKALLAVLMPFFILLLFVSIVLGAFLSLAN